MHISLSTNNHLRNKKGIISTIVLIIIALIILGYYKINVKDLVSQPLVKDNLAYAWQLFVSGFKGFVAFVQSYLPKLDSFT